MEPAAAVRARDQHKLRGDIELAFEEEHPGHHQAKQAAELEEVSSRQLPPLDPTATYDGRRLP